MIDNQLLEQLSVYADTEKIKEIDNKIDTANNEQVNEYVEQLQAINNSIYEKHGYNDTTLEFQIYINELRSKHDITDPTEIIHKDNGKGFVQ